MFGHSICRFFCLAAILGLLAESNVIDSNYGGDFGGLDSVGNNLESPKAFNGNANSAFVEKSPEMGTDENTFDSDVENNLKSKLANADDDVDVETMGKGDAMVAAKVSKDDGEADVGTDGKSDNIVAKANNAESDANFDVENKGKSKVAEFSHSQSKTEGNNAKTESNAKLPGDGFAQVFQHAVPNLKLEGKQIRNSAAKLLNLSADALSGGYYRHSAHDSAKTQREGRRTRIERDHDEHTETGDRIGNSLKFDEARHLERIRVDEEARSGGHNHSFTIMPPAPTTNTTAEATDEATTAETTTAETTETERIVIVTTTPKSTSTTTTTTTSTSTTTTTPKPTTTTASTTTTTPTTTTPTTTTTRPSTTKTTVLPIVLTSTTTTTTTTTPQTTTKATTPSTSTTITTTTTEPESTTTASTSTSTTTTTTASTTTTPTTTTTSTTTNTTPPPAFTDAETSVPTPPIPEALVEHKGSMPIFHIVMWAAVVGAVTSAVALLLVYNGILFGSGTAPAAAPNEIF